MTKSKFARTTLFSAVASLALSSVAFAGTADISNTGPDSANTITIESSNHIDISNDNNVTVKNSNTQTAYSGDASVIGNTTGGAATSGAATNTNSVSTTVGITNPTCDCIDGVGGNNNTGGGNHNTGGLGGSTLGSTAKGGGGSGVGGGGSTSVGTLPETGASGPVDVSALRNMLNPVSETTPLSGAVKANKAISTIALALAAVLSLLAAIGTAVYSTKRTLKV